MSLFNLSVCLYRSRHKGKINILYRKRYFKLFLIFFRGTYGTVLEIKVPCGNETQYQALILNNKLYYYLKQNAAAVTVSAFYFTSV